MRIRLVLAYDEAYLGRNLLQFQINCCRTVIRKMYNLLIDNKVS